MTITTNNPSGTSGKGESFPQWLQRQQRTTTDDFNPGQGRHGVRHEKALKTKENRNAEQ